MEKNTHSDRDISKNSSYHSPKQEPLSQVKTEEHPKHHVQGILFSILSCVGFSVGNYIAGTQSKLGLLTRFVTEIGGFVYVLIFTFISVITKLKDGKAPFSWEESPYRNPETNKFYWARLFGVLCNVVNEFAGGMCVILAFGFAIDAEINQGIISTLFGLSSFFAAILAYFAFSEKLNIYHWIGMVLIFICAVGIGFGSIKVNETVDRSTTSKVIPTILSIVFGILAPIFFSTNSIIIKYVYINTKMSPADITFCCYTISGTLMGIGAILMYNYGGYTFDLKTFVYIVIGGLINSFGLLFKGIALSITFAGPVQAIQNYQFNILCTFFYLTIY